jgi:hypothetical protein
MDSEVEEKLYDLWYNVENPSAFTGLNRFWQFIKDKNINVTKKQVKEWLSDQVIYSKYAPVRQKFQRNKIISWGISYLFQADLADMHKLSRFNFGINFLLVVVCTFSKYVMVRGLKNKSGKEVAAALDDIFSNERKPLYFQTDLGIFLFNIKYILILN